MKNTGYLWEVRHHLRVHFIKAVLLFNALAELIVFQSNSDKYQICEWFKTQWCFCIVLQTFNNKSP